MFAVEIYAAVRRFVFVEGKSGREAARVFGLSRGTIAKMCRYSAPPGLRSKAPERPKLGPLVLVIDAILESDKTAPPKQRHTAKRIFERLRIEHGYAGGYTVVKDYVRIARTCIQEIGVDGFWIHRVFAANGIESHVVEAASIAVPRRHWRAKTDTIDGELLLAHADGVKERRASRMRDGGCAHPRGRRPTPAFTRAQDDGQRAN
jgi:hypothetical protein